MSIIFYDEKLLQVASNAWLCKEPPNVLKEATNTSLVVNGTGGVEEMMEVNSTLGQGRGDNSSSAAQHCYTDLDTVLPYPDVSH